jgi:hypothetical protein
LTCSSGQHADVLGQPREELLDQAALADARLAEQRHHVTPVRFDGPLEGLGEESKLAPAIDERDRAPGRTRR